MEPSFFLKLARRLPKKTPRSEAYALPGSGSATPSKETQEALEMPPPEVPSSRQPELPPSGSILQRLESDPQREHQSGDSSYASAEEPEEQQGEKGTNPSSSKRRKSWASLTSSVSDEEMHARSVDLQSHDPRPASVLAPEIETPGD